ncbi:50S ribosomal protein L21 [Flexistipes sinusarabici DSM 4947]|uniref:Large ribosomal subunit protein bL21 n=1 Tax=Flexistipes sinusarabici (strain ATCC 49648 / DSM 4947 / MAS 10) TaxID=717231 RepID=F8E5Y4_FLESM|nr:50S ribosomal protein L21 [Flexistipes sinusarabici]AEI15825.1 50S ribosomal protein L21 [Flexistipes sinusarabici DSM 4947]
MFAILKTGGKQYTVKPGDIIDVEKIEAEKGGTIELKNILAVSDDKKFNIGNPYLDNASVEAEVVDQIRGKKVVVFKRKPKKDYKRKYGHRQYFTKLKVKEIKV